MTDCKESIVQLKQTETETLIAISSQWTVKRKRQNCQFPVYKSEVESSRTSLASRTHFEVLGLEGQVLGLGLEASSPRKLACPRLEDSTIFWNVKILWSAWKIFWKTFFSGDRLKNFCEDLFFFFFFFFWRSPEKFLWRPFFFFFFLESTCALCPWSLASSIPVLGLESVCPRKGCPWPWPRIFFVSLALALASSLVSSTPPLLLIESMI